MGRRGKRPLSRNELRGAYREACTEIRRLNNQLSEMIQDNIRLSGRLAEIDLSQDRLDVFVVPLDQPTEELPAPVPVDLVKRPTLRVVQIIPAPLSAEEAARNMKTFMDRIHEAAGERAIDQEMRIL